MNIPEELRSNKGLCQAIKILRLFQIQVRVYYCNLGKKGKHKNCFQILSFQKDLRTLQDQVNATIESAQKLTADPKTDTRLGKVGR